MHKLIKTTFPHRRRRHKQSGSAIFETVVSIPFLAMIISLIFFFGWANRNKQQVKIASRYSAWKSAKGGGWPSGLRLEDLFLSGGGEIVHRRNSDGPEDTLHALAAKSGEDYSPAEEFVRETVVEKYPRGHGTELTVEFPPPQSYWRQFITGPMQSYHIRDGRQWRRNEARCWKELSEVYFSELDQTLSNVSQPGTDMGKTFRDLYLVNW